MDFKHIEALVEKYWNCETTLEEETQLKEFFRGKNVPETLKETAELFRYFEYQKKVTLKSASFDPEIAAKIKKPVGKLISLVQLARIAAGVLVLVVATFFIRQEIKKAYPEQPADTFSDPKVAFEETKKALMMISKGFNKAKKGTEKINLFNDAQQKIQNKPGEKKSNI